MLKKWLLRANSFLGIFVVVGVLYVLQHALQHYSYREIILAIRAIPTYQVLAALVLTIINYLFLVGYDMLAFEYIGQPVRLRDIFFTSFIRYCRIFF